MHCCGRVQGGARCALPEATDCLCVLGGSAADRDDPVCCASVGKEAGGACTRLALGLGPAHQLPSVQLAAWCHAALGCCGRVAGSSAFFMRPTLNDGPPQVTSNKPPPLPHIRRPSSTCWSQTAHSQARPVRQSRGSLSGLWLSGWARARSCECGGRGRVYALDSVRARKRCAAHRAPQPCDHPHCNHLPSPGRAAPSPRRSCSSRQAASRPSCSRWTRPWRPRRCPLPPATRHATCRASWQTWRRCVQ